MRLLRCLTAVTSVTTMALSAVAHAQGPEITFHPARPAQGSLFRVSVSWPDAVSLRGTIAREAIHFERDSVGTFHAVAAVSVEAGGEVPGTLWPGDARDSMAIAVPVTARVARSERLRLPTEYVAPPDSALARRIAGERNQINAALARAHAEPRMWGSLWFSPPRRGAAITSGYGTRRVLNGETQSRHMGLDYDGRVGEPVHATNRGTVILVGDFFYNGKCVYVAHGAGLVTSYLHLSATHVVVGQTVERGQLIGAVGATGRVTGPHLHWSVLYGRISVDPLSLLSLRPLPTAGPATEPSGVRSGASR